LPLGPRTRARRDTPEQRSDGVDAAPAAEKRGPLPTAERYAAA